MFKNICWSIKALDPKWSWLNGDKKLRELNRALNTIRGRRIYGIFKEYAKPENGQNECGLKKNQGGNVDNETKYVKRPQTQSKRNRAANV